MTQATISLGALAGELEHCTDLSAFHLSLSLSLSTNHFICKDRNHCNTTLKT